MSGLRPVDVRCGEGSPGAGSRMNKDDLWMALALEEARKARADGEVPVGAVVVFAGRVIGRGRNRPIGLNDPTAHAEILAIRQAAAALGNYRLEKTTLYVTVEPCLMCAGALIASRVSRLVFGARDPKGGAVVSLYGALDDGRLNHRVIVTEGVLAGDCAEILSGFFREKRITSRLLRNGDCPSGEIPKRS